MAISESVRIFHLEPPGSDCIFVVVSGDSANSQSKDDNNFMVKKISEVGASVKDGR